MSASFSEIISNPPMLDGVIIGAGFSGLYTLWKLREVGFSVKILELGSAIGGTWYHNRYPGARVDSGIPIYQLSIEKAWSNFEWSEKFPGREEILRYFEHLDKTLDLRKDIEFNTRVVSATFDESLHLWEVKTLSGRSMLTRHLILCVGSCSKKYIPEFSGLNKFRGQLYHSADWPEENVPLRGKHVAVVGTGASGVQIIQEIGPIVDHLTVYQRTPNLALPLRQTKSRDVPFAQRSQYKEAFAKTRTTFGGMDFDFAPKTFSDSTPQQRKSLYESTWAIGGFNFALANYAEIYFDQSANNAVYAFWRDKVRQRVKNEATRDLLAPLVQPHPFGTKRPSLEQSYYEVFNQNNVDLINVKESPILEIIPTGIKTADGRHVEVDVIILATGFDTNTGGILNISIKNGGGTSIAEKWGQRTSTFLGITVSGFPNMFLLYGPQAPTAFSNGPTCIEIQADWMIDLMVDMRSKKRARVEADKQAEDVWVAMVRHVWEISLFRKAESWYQGANIPGKRREPLNFAGGIPAYRKTLNECRDEGYRGLHFK
ncbi:baeyer-Villiger monooxygenase [Folsomia candida]|uniref:Flavin-containing monooxygenase n=1 Tax=Folsomia candida TaxID=158441 RepID=A0A226DHU9_FOLCA|nr:baeyer-Villiger monooxygenase [Folsomia candida]OXA45122.1 Baeyer-Villiger monooxygenase [Folsomia candida]